MRIGEWSVVERPCVRGRTFVQLPIRACVPAVPLAYVRRPIGDTRRADRRTGSKRASTDSADACESGVVVVVVTIGGDMERIVPWSGQAGRGSARPIKRHRELATSLKIVPEIS